MNLRICEKKINKLGKILVVCRILKKIEPSLGARGHGAGKAFVQSLSVRTVTSINITVDLEKDMPSNFELPRSPTFQKGCLRL